MCVDCWYIDLTLDDFGQILAWEVGEPLAMDLAAVGLVADMPPDRHKGMISSSCVGYWSWFLN